MSDARVVARDLLSFTLWVTVALTASIWLLPTQAAGQAIYGSLTGTITDTSSAAVPGATVAIKNEDTGLELTGTTDSSGTYTIRNITGGTYTLKASLQGFKEFVQTGVLITAGSIIRINGRLEIGTLSEAVTVTSEATVLKTDQADVSVDLRPEDVTNLPLNQYRNYQVPAEPGPWRHASCVPERANGHARPRTLDEHQRDESQQQRDTDRWCRQHQRVAASPRRLHCAG